MLSDQTLLEYRQLTPGQRLELTLEMVRDATPYLLRGSAGELSNANDSSCGPSLATSAVKVEC